MDYNESATLGDLQLTSSWGDLQDVEVQGEVTHQVFELLQETLIKHKGYTLQYYETKQFQVEELGWDIEEVDDEFGGWTDWDILENGTALTDCSFEEFTKDYTQKINIIKS